MRQKISQTVVENNVSAETAGLVDGVEGGGDDGGGEDEPDDGDAFEEPIYGMQHEISREILSLGLSARRGDSLWAERTGVTKGLRFGDRKQWRAGREGICFDGDGGGEYTARRRGARTEDWPVHLVCAGDLLAATIPPLRSGKKAPLLRSGWQSARC